jgi:type I restriction enzyme M protein
MAPQQLSFEDVLWQAFDELRSSIDLSDYKNVVSGLIFLKYVDDAYQERRGALRDKLAADGIIGEQADELMESPYEYTAAGTFWIPPQARWGYLRERAKQPEIGKLIDRALDLIEHHNPILSGMLPKTHGWSGLDPGRLSELVDLISALSPITVWRREPEVYGRVYERLLGNFASKDRSSGEFYTPRSVARLLVEMIEPYSGRLYDPCCGSGGMFMQAKLLMEANDGHRDDPVAYGQELNHMARELAKVSLALYDTRADFSPCSGASFHEDVHADPKADYILANPPFNMSGWDRAQFRDDTRWEYGVPPVSNANFAWLQHIVSHLSPHGIAGVVLPNGSVSSQQPSEAEIRRRMIEADLIECIITLPGQLFYSTQIPVTLWFLNREKTPNGVRGGRDRRGETLFIDARRLGMLRDHTHRELTDDDVARITGTYEAWRGKAGADRYVDMPGFCASATIERIAKHRYMLMPGHYVGVEDVGEDNEPLDEKTICLTQGPDSRFRKERSTTSAQSAAAGSTRMTTLLGEVPSNWEYLTLGELCACGNGTIQTGPGGKQLHASDYALSGIPVVMPVNIGDNRIIAERITHIPRLDAERLARYRLRTGDIVHSRRGTVERRALVSDREEGWLCGTGSIRIRPGSAVNSKWLSYYLGHSRVRAWIVRHAVGTTMLHLNSSILSDLPVLVPPVNEQQAIAEMLGALDDKIEINERLHDLCHDQASALLTKVLDAAKSDGTLEQGHLGDVTTLNVRNVNPRTGTLKYLNVSAVGVGRAKEPTVMQWAAAPRRARRAVKDGDILWSTARPDRKSHCLVLDPDPDLVVSTAFAVLTPVSVGPSFLYAITEQPEFVDYLVSVANGAAYPTVRPERFLQAPLPLPSRDALTAFEESTMPLRRRAGAALNESRKLAALRDTLLPVLLTGELSVHDAEVLAGKAV